MDGQICNRLNRAIFEVLIHHNAPHSISRFARPRSRRKCDSMDLTNIIYSLGLVGYLDEDFFQTATDEVEKRMRKGEVRMGRREIYSIAI